MRRTEKAHRDITNTVDVRRNGGTAPQGPGIFTSSLCDLENAKKDAEDGGDEAISLISTTLAVHQFTLLSHNPTENYVHNGGFFCDHKVESLRRDSNSMKQQQ